jgi:hypothetical protein
MILTRISIQIYLQMFSIQLSNKTAEGTGKGIQFTKRRFYSLFFIGCFYWLFSLVVFIGSFIGCFIGCFYW